MKTFNDFVLHTEYNSNLYSQPEPFLTLQSQMNFIWLFYYAHLCTLYIHPTNFQSSLFVCICIYNNWILSFIFSQTSLPQVAATQNSIYPLRCISNCSLKSLLQFSESFLFLILRNHYHSNHQSSLYWNYLYSCLSSQLKAPCSIYFVRSPTHHRRIVW